MRSHSPKVRTLAECLATRSTGDDTEAQSTLVGIVTSAGPKALDAGLLQRARELEAIRFLQMTPAAAFGMTVKARESRANAVFPLFRGHVDAGARERGRAWFRSRLDGGRAEGSGGHAITAATARRLAQWVADRFTCTHLGAAPRR